MNIVTTGLGDINAKEKISFDIYKSEYEQKQYNRPLLTCTAKHIFWKLGPSCQKRIHDCDKFQRGIREVFFHFLEVFENCIEYSTAIVKFRFVSGLGDNLSR